jgi:hypothetical protein
VDVCLFLHLCEKIYLFTLVTVQDGNGNIRSTDIVWIRAASMAQNNNPGGTYREPSGFCRSSYEESRGIIHLFYFLCVHHEQVDAAADKIENFFGPLGTLIILYTLLFFLFFFYTTYICIADQTVGHWTPGGGWLGGSPYGNPWIGRVLQINHVGVPFVFNFTTLSNAYANRIW